MEEDDKSSQEVLDKDISPEKVSDASFKPLHWQQLEKGHGSLKQRVGVQ